MSQALLARDTFPDPTSQNHIKTDGSISSASDLKSSEKIEKRLDVTAGLHVENSSSDGPPVSPWDGLVLHLIISNYNRTVATVG
jgi:hypothetical protein